MQNSKINNKEGYRLQVTGNSLIDGFTLIELLIVVAIIAILAAIAIPNFLAAQTRSKVSRTKGDMRTITTGLEAYAVDNNVYPPNDYETHPTGLGYLVTPVTLTTPISYLGTNRIPDPFAIGLFDPDNPLPGEERFYTYQNLDNIVSDTAFQNQFPLNWTNIRGYFGRWRQASVGPDRDYYNAGNGSALVYDPTNGTVSYGNIWLGQKAGFNDGQYDGTVTYSD